MVDERSSPSIVTRGKDIRNHSFHQREDEVLLLPGREFQVISCCDYGNDLYEIHLKEIRPKNCLLAPLPAHDKRAPSVSKFDDQGLTGKNKNRMMASQLTENIHLEKSWLQLQFVDSNRTKIKKPHELENDISQPPRPTENRIFDRIAGSMLAMAIGDTLGAHVEYRPRAYLEAHPVKDFQGGGTWGLEKGQVRLTSIVKYCIIIGYLYVFSSPMIRRWRCASPIRSSRVKVSICTISW